MQCDINPFLRMVDNYHLCIIIFSFAIALSFRNKRWAVLTGITAFNYYITYVTLCDILIWDTSKIWRYVIWIGWEALWMTVVYVVWQRKLAYQYQAVAVILLGLAGNLLQVFRFIDRHYFELAYSTPIYTTMAPAFNNLLVLICLYPLISYFKIGISKWQSR
jgi:hypothetical protein